MISWRWCRCWCCRCRWGVLICCLLVTAAAVITRYHYWSGAARHAIRIIVRCALWQAPHVVAARRRTSGHSAFGGPAWCGPLISSVILIVRMCLEWRLSVAPRPPGEAGGCTDECWFANDGECDDGGPGAEYRYCRRDTQPSL